MENISPGQMNDATLHLLQVGLSYNNTSLGSKEYVGVFV